MTVSSETSSIEYAGDSVSVDFPIPFNFLANSDIQVATRDASGDATIISVGFTITGAGTGLGNANFTVAPATGTSVVLSRVPALLQPVDLVSNDRFPAETIETAYDRQTFISQALKEITQRSIRVPYGDHSAGALSELPAASSRKGKVLAFDSGTGQPQMLAIGSISGLAVALTASILGTLLYPRTANEIAASVTPSLYFYAPGDVRRYNSDPTGIADSTTPFQQASSSNLKVDIPEGTYKITGQVLNASRAVTYIGAARGAVTLNLNNNADALKWTGTSSGGGIKRLVINVTGMTSGYAISSTQSRFFIDDLNFTGSSTGANLGGIFLQDFNSAQITNLWMNGSYGTNGIAIKLYGSGINSANVCDINNVVYGGAGGASSTSSIFLVVDGGVATVDIRHASAVACYAALVTTNSPGLANFAQFIEGDDFQADGIYSDALVFGTSGTGNTTGHNFNKLYVHHAGQNNSGAGIGKGTGVYIYANCRASRFQGGDILTCNLGAMFIDGNNINVADMDMRKNSQDSVGTYPAVQLGANSFGCNIHHNTLGQNTGAATSDQSYGVQLDVGAKNHIVVHNYLLLNTLNAINDLAQDPNTLIKDNLYAGNTTFHAALAPAAMGATVNNYNPVNWSVNVANLRLTPNVGNTTINGLFTGAGASTWIHGTTVLLQNLSAADSVILAHLNGGSNAWNQFSMPSAGPLTIPPLGTQQIMYDGFLSKWIKA